MAHQSTDHCVWNCLESVRGAPYELSNNTEKNVLPNKIMGLYID